MDDTALQQTASKKLILGDLFEFVFEGVVVFKRGQNQGPLSLDPNALETAQKVPETNRWLVDVVPIK